MIGFSGCCELQVSCVDWRPRCLSGLFSQRPPPGDLRRILSSSLDGWERRGEGNVSKTVWEPHFSLVVSVSRASTLNQYGFCWRRKSSFTGLDLGGKQGDAG